MDNELQFIREVCIKANPNGEYIIWACEGCQTIYGEYVNGCPKCWNNNLSREENKKYFPERSVTLRERRIRLADVLLAIAQIKPWADVELRDIQLDISKYGTDGRDNCLWNLKQDDLTLQGKETIEFISNLLKS